jgi:biofilm protein TabA
VTFAKSHVTVGAPEEIKGFTIATMSLYQSITSRQCTNASQKKNRIEKQYSFTCTVKPDGIMIFDTLDSLRTCSCIPCIRQVADFLEMHDPADFENGSHEIQGQVLILNKSEYVLRDIRNTRFESHRRYADLHLVISGREIVKTVFPPDAHNISPYDDMADAEFFSAGTDVTDFILRPDTFLFLAPGEIHLPACRCGDYDGNVVKCVVKILYPHG